MNGCVLFRVDGTNRLGLGHVKRCLVLAGALKARGDEVAFLACRLDDGARALVEGDGFRLFRLPEDTFLEGEAAVVEGLGLSRPLVLIIDFAHRDVLAARDRLPAYFRAMKRVVDRIALFDGLGEESIAAEAGGEADLVVTPYFGAEIPEGEGGSGRPRHAGGAPYMVFDPAFDAWRGKLRPIAAVARNLLITTGGADPTGIAAKALAAVNGMASPRLNIRVVVGPAFSDELKARLDALARRSPHACRLVGAPENLAQHMAWCDLAIATTGLTKYELALVGAPALLLSLNAVHAANNRPFDAMGTARHLGIDGELAAEDIRAALAELVPDRRARQDMSRRGLQCLDGRGLERIINELDRMVGENV